MTDCRITGSSLSPSADRQLQGSDAYRQPVGRAFFLDTYIRAGSSSPLLGTAIAYIAGIAWFRSNLSGTIGPVPADDLIVILVGLPLAGSIGGWLFGGRDLPAIVRRPME